MAKVQKRVGYKTIREHEFMMQNVVKDQLQEFRLEMIEQHQRPQVSSKQKHLYRIKGRDPILKQKHWIGLGADLRQKGPIGSCASPVQVNWNVCGEGSS